MKNRVNDLWAALVVAMGGDECHGHHDEVVPACAKNWKNENMHHTWQWWVARDKGEKRSTISAQRNVSTRVVTNWSHRVIMIVTLVAIHGGWRQTLAGYGNTEDSYGDWSLSRVIEKNQCPNSERKKKKRKKKF